MEVKELPIVLVIDDEPHLNEAIRLSLEDCDFEVFSAYTGAEGFEILRQNPIDLCIVDMRLPDTTGNDFIKAAYRDYPQLRFMIYTGSIDYIIPQKLKEIGISEEQVFIKPIKDFSKFVDTVKKIHQNNQ